MQRRPLADRLRPTSFAEVAGQRHLLGEGGALAAMIERGYLPNMIFWGPPGTGKTTVAGIIAARSGMTLHRLNATSASTQDVKDVIAESGTLLGSAGTLLYLDEIQYFNKKQQQTLVESLESGSVTLIASTTENPYMYVYNALISRSVVFEFKSLAPGEISGVLLRGLGELNGEQCGSAVAPTVHDGESYTAEGGERAISDGALDYISRAAAGDVRRSLNILEAAYFSGTGSVITSEDARSASPEYGTNFDRDGTVHYDLLSALQKSIRGSDPDAAIFYLVRILEGGDLIGACRRLLVIASEDIGCAYPQAAPIVYSCVAAAKELGMPEASIPLSNAVITLATAPKSNSAHMAYERAKAVYSSGKGLEIPSYMRPSDRYEGYKYPHDYPNSYVEQQYLPSDVAGQRFYEYGANKNEQAARAYWEKIKGTK